MLNARQKLPSEEMAVGKDKIKIEVFTGYWCASAMSYGNLLRLKALKKHLNRV
jgi:hypothetical protein